MKKFYTPTKDTSIYQTYPENNAGLDEILEIGKIVKLEDSTTTSAYETASVRTLIHFDLPTTESVNANADYYLNLRLANATNIRRGQEILIYPISSSWVEGSGFFYQDVKNSNDGATWRQFKANVSWSNQGGDFYTTNSGSASINLTSYPLQDLRIDVTNILRPIVSKSLQSNFNGLLLKFPNTDELDSDNQGLLQVFSTQTHTIHGPTLEVSWIEQTMQTGSSLLPTPNTLNVKVVPNNLQEIYTKGDVSKINLVVRDTYPLKSFDSTLRYKNKYYLPTSSYYSVVDVQSNTVIVPFDDGTRINADTSGSYIILDTSTLYEGRFYSIKVKVNNGPYSKVFTFDSNFKVV